MKKEVRAPSWSIIRPGLMRGVAILSCFFILFLGFPQSYPFLDSSPADLSSIHADDNGTAPSVSSTEEPRASEEQCRGALGCLLFLPSTPTAFASHTKKRIFGLMKISRGIGPSPSFRPPRILFFASTTHLRQI